jgi:hypothetical protein
MMVVAGSLAIEIMSQLSSLVPPPQAIFLLQISEHAIIRLVLCTPVKQYKCNRLPPGQVQGRASMREQRFACPHRRVPMDI